MVSRSRQRTPGIGWFTSGTAARRPGKRGPGARPLAAAAARSCASIAARVNPRGSRWTTATSVARVDPKSLSARCWATTALASEGTMSLSGAVLELPSPGRKASEATSAAIHARTIG